MKKIFTLIAMALMAVGASAQSSWVAPESAPAAGMSIIKDDLMKVETVFETTCGKILDQSNQPAPVTFAGKTFETYMQIRVDAAPTNDAPTGTEKSGSTPLVITAKKNVDLTIYYRRQAVEGAYSENDGKDIKLVDQTKATTAIKSASYEATDIDGSYGNVKRVYNLEEGKTYTLFTRGTTGRLYGMDYAEGTGAGEQGAVADGTYFISFDGLSAGNKVTTDKGFTLQITGNEEKTYSAASKITIDGAEYTTIKLSNGAQNTLTLPEGKVATGITFYSYVNKDAETERAAYWKEVGGTEYTETPNGGNFKSYKDTENPDVCTYSFGENKLNAITFTNTGEQCCFVIKIAIAAGTATGINAINAATIDVNAPAYNLAGQKVDKSFKGVVIQNGKKMIQK